MSNSYINWSLVCELYEIDKSDFDIIQEALTDFGVKFKPPARVQTQGQDPEAGMLKMRIGGYDKRKLMFKGVIELEDFEYAGHSGTFCVMHRDQVRFFL